MEIKHIRRTATALLVALSLWCLNAKAQQATEVDLDEQYATELLKPRTVAPDFELPSPDCKKVSLSQFKGKYVVLDFWASGAPTAAKTHPTSLPCTTGLRIRVWHSWVYRSTLTLPYGKPPSINMV